MHIENVHIHLGEGRGLSAGELAKIRGFDMALRETPPASGTESAAIVPPAIGQPWPGIDGIYAGVSKGEEGQPDAHLVLLAAQPGRNMKWEDAVAWAQGLGDGARLPTRFESALLYAHLQDQFDTSNWHWTGTQYSSNYAWGQYFDDGRQDNGSKKAEARARAVRRLIL
jgi:hypothetical protein